MRGLAHYSNIQGITVRDQCPPGLPAALKTVKPPTLPAESACQVDGPNMNRHDTMGVGPRASETTRPRNHDGTFYAEGPDMSLILQVSSVAAGERQLSVKPLPPGAT